MADRPVLGSRRVGCLRGTERGTCELSWWLEDERYGVAAEGPFGRRVAIADDAFEALVRIRSELEVEGWLLAVQGSRLDTYPSGMARDMGGGLRVYALRLGEPATTSALVGTFDGAETDALATVDQQRAYFEDWLRSIDG